MPTAGPNNAGTAANRASGRGGPAWVNPTNAQGAQNGTNATSTGDTLNQSDFLDLTNMGWSAPAGVVVSNLLVEVFWGASANGTKANFNLNDTSHNNIASASNLIPPTVAAWATLYNADPPAGFDALFIGNTDEYEIWITADANVTSVDAIRVTVTYALPGGMAMQQVRTTNKFVGPQALRFRYRQPYLPDITLAPPVNFEFGPILQRLPSPRRGPPAMRASFREPFIPDITKAIPTLRITFDTMVAERNTLGITWDTFIADIVRRTLSITWDYIVGVSVGPAPGAPDPATGLTEGAADLVDWLSPGSGYLDSVRGGYADPGINPVAGMGAPDSPQTGSAWEPRP